MRYFPLLVLSLLLFACSGTLEESRGKLTIGAPPKSLSSAERCSSLSDRSTAWGAVGMGTAVLSGASGLGALPADGSVELGLAIGSLTLGGVSAASMFVSQESAASWARECSP